MIPSRARSAGAALILLTLLGAAPLAPAGDAELRAVGAAARLIGATVQSGKHSALGAEGKRALVDYAQAS